MFDCIQAGPQCCSAFLREIIHVALSLSLLSEIVMWELFWESSICGPSDFCHIV